MASLLLRGYLLGFAIAASPGPLFFLCLRRTLTRGWRVALVSGLGVATADGGYAAITAFGVSAISSLLVSERRWLTLVGGIALVVIGARTLLARPAQGQLQSGGESVATTATRISSSKGYVTAYLSTLSLTITNPATIIAFAAVFTSLGFGLRTSAVSPVLVVGGVALGSTTWWLLVVGLASGLRARVTPRLVGAIGTAAGLAILALALLVVVSSLTT